MATCVTAMGNTHLGCWRLACHLPRRCLQIGVELHIVICSKIPPQQLGRDMCTSPMVFFFLCPEDTKPPISFSDAIHCWGCRSHSLAQRPFVQSHMGLGTHPNEETSLHCWTGEMTRNPAFLALKRPSGSMTPDVF